MGPLLRLVHASSSHAAAPKRTKWPSVCSRWDSGVCEQGQQRGISREVQIMEKKYSSQKFRRTSAAEKGKMMDRGTDEVKRENARVVLPEPRRRQRYKKISP